MTTFSGSFSTDESGRIKEDIFQDLVEQDLGSPIALIDQIALGRGRPNRSGQISMDLSGDDPSGGVYDPSRMAALRSIANRQTGGDPSISQPPDYTTPSMKNFRSLVPGGLASIPNVRNIESGNYLGPVAPYTGMEQMLTRQAQAGQGEAYKDFFFDEASRDPSIFDPLQSFVQKAFGYPEGMRGLYEMEQNKKAAMARNEELEEFSRKDREDRERAALLAAQNQPVDPCPEGYRLDPMSKVCVPTDDTTTDTAPGTGRVY